MKRKLSFILALAMLCSMFMGCGAEISEETVTSPTEESIFSETQGEAENDPPVDYAMLIGKVEGESSGFSKCVEDRDVGTVTVLQSGTRDDAPVFAFYYEGKPLSGRFWAVQGKIRIRSDERQTGQVDFFCYTDKSNYATISVCRTENVSSGIRRSIVTGGQRKMSGEYVSANLADGRDYTAEFAVIYADGRFMLYLKEEGEEFTLMAQYGTEFGSCEARMAVPQYANVTLSDMAVVNEMTAVEAMEKEMNEKNQTTKQGLRVLFIGNSATFTHDLPQMLQTLARKAGYDITTDSYAKSGYELSRYLEDGNVNKTPLLNKIATGFDIVFLQDNSECALSEEKGDLSWDAHEVFDKAIRAAGGETYMYIRPPSGKDKSGLNSFAQCREYDKFFGSISAAIGAENAYVNRAFAYAIENTSYNLWGSDNAHVSEYGAYLAVCVFFATLYDTSSSVLDSNGIIPDADAMILQDIADKIVLDGYIPW